DGEHVPLDLEPGVGAGVVGVADHRVAGADDASQQDKPVADPADMFVEPINRRAETKQRLHVGDLPPTTPLSRAVIPDGKCSGGLAELGLTATGFWSRYQPCHVSVWSGASQDMSQRSN